MQVGALNSAACPAGAAPGQPGRARKPSMPLSADASMGMEDTLRCRPCSSSSQECHVPLSLSRSHFACIRLSHHLHDPTCLACACSNRQTHESMNLASVQLYGCVTCSVCPSACALLPRLG